jgi:CRISPR/Cas system CSM-associated protein Csm3 (group 7 of RAMP superfamily)
MVTRLNIAYRAGFSTSLHIGTGLGFAKMIDDLFVRAGPARGEGARLPCIPGSSIKGKTRSRCEAIARMLDLNVCGDSTQRRCKTNPCILCRIFGSTFNQGTLRFSDAQLVKELRKLASPPPGEKSPDPFALSVVRAGNKLERATRTVEPKFLFAMENTAEELQFEGSITGWVESPHAGDIDGPLPLEGWLLIIGLGAVDKLGGLRSRGLGRCRIAVTELVIDGKTDENLAGDLTDLLSRDDYLLGLSEYEVRNSSKA